MAQHRTWHIAYDMTLAPTCRGVSGEGPPLIWGLFPSACNSWQVGMLSYQSELRERAKGPDVLLRMSVTEETSQDPIF